MLVLGHLEELQAHHLHVNCMVLARHASMVMTTLPDNYVI